MDPHAPAEDVSPHRVSGHDRDDREGQLMRLLAQRDPHPERGALRVRRNEALSCVGVVFHCGRPEQLAAT